MEKIVPGTLPISKPGPASTPSLSNSGCLLLSFLVGETCWGSVMLRGQTHLLLQHKTSETWVVPSQGYATGSSGHYRPSQRPCRKGGPRHPKALGGNFQEEGTPGYLSSCPLGFTWKTLMPGDLEMNWGCWGYVRGHLVHPVS